MGAVGRNVPRKEGLDKVTGRAKYVDDLTFPGMLHGRTIRSTIAAGEIEGVHLGFSRKGFTIADCRDVPGRNVVALIELDQPCLAERRVRHFAEPILLLAHEDRERLLEAEARIAIDYRETAPNYDPEKSDRCFKEIVIEKGELARGFAEADVVVEGEYRVGHQEQLYIEPNGVIAVPENGGITVYGSLQCPYYVHRALRGVIRHRTGVTRDGRMTAIEIDVLLDGGAYMTLSPVVLSRGVIHATGPYRCDHVRIHGRVVATNTPPNGAFRGFGAPQTQFAAEVHMERIAEALGMDPVRLREKNAFRPGDTTSTGQKLGRDTSALRVLHEAVSRSDFRAKRRAYRGTNRGIGLALFFHGSGFTGGGEVKLASKASLELTETGARILVASTEIGQGTRTMHAQIVADTLEIPYEKVEVEAVDTARVPDSGPTVASRTCMVVGKILERCAQEIRRELGGRTARDYLAERGPLVVTKEYSGPDGLYWDDETYRGDAYGAFGWGCDVVEVERDPETWEIRPTRITAVCEIGRAIHPVLAAGQIEGGTAQAVGYALLEEVAIRDGRMANAQLTNYLVPTTLDTPPIDVAILENPYEHGPFGAKGVGEMPIDGPAPAIVNAIRSLGLDVRSIPATPERILEAPAVQNPG